MSGSVSSFRLALKRQVPGDNRAKTQSEFHGHRRVEIEWNSGRTKAETMADRSDGDWRQQRHRVVVCLSQRSGPLARHSSFGPHHFGEHPQDCSLRFCTRQFEKTKQIKTTLFVARDSVPLGGQRNATKPATDAGYIIRAPRYAQDVCLFSPKRRGDMRSVELNQQVIFICQRWD